MKQVIVTPKQCKEFWRRTAKREGFQVIQKASAIEMRAVAWAVKGIGGDKNWMSDYSITVGDRVYVPFEIGAGTNMDRILQVGTCMHEAQHVRQFKRNTTKYLTNYFFSTAGRTHYEADAYRVTMESYYFFTGVVRSPRSLANNLRGYYVGDDDIYVCEKHLKSAAALIKHGVITSGISKSGLRWWMNKAEGHAKVYL
jgi:hypothetical protein